MQCQGFRHHHLDIHIVLITAEVLHRHAYRSGSRDGTRQILRHRQQIRGRAVVAYRHILAGDQIRNSVSTVIRAHGRHGGVHRRDGRQFVVHRVNGGRIHIRDAGVTLIDGQLHLVDVTGTVAGDMEGVITARPPIIAVTLHAPAVASGTRQVHQLGGKHIVNPASQRTNIRCGSTVNLRLQDGLRGIKGDGIVGDVIDSVSHHGKISGKQRGVVRRAV